MRKPLSLAHKVKIVGRKIDLQHTDVGATFRRVRTEQQANTRERAAKVKTITRKVA